MTWPAQIERWRQIAIWDGRDIPADLILAIIAHESNGTPGAVSIGTTQAAIIPSGSADLPTIQVNHALGLMQTIGSTINWYNDAGRGTEAPTNYAEMTGVQERDVRQQIRVGSALLALQIAKLHQFDFVTFPSRSAAGATPDQMLFALVAYAVGGGWKATTQDGPGLKPRLIALKNAGLPLTFANLANNNPLWGKSNDPERGWLNRPIQMARATYAAYRHHAGAPGGQPGTEIAQKPAPGDLADRVIAEVKNNWIVIVVLAALWFFSQRQAEDLDQVDEAQEPI